MTEHKAKCRGAGFRWGKRLALVLGGLIVVVVVSNMISQQRLYFWAMSKKWDGATLLCVGDSPDGKYAIQGSINIAYGGAGMTLSISRWYYLTPKAILWSPAGGLGDEVIARGPWKREFDVVWSKDGRYAATVHRGWFADAYDLQEDRPIPREEGPSRGRIINPDGMMEISDWKAYHERIRKLMGEDPQSVKLMPTFLWRGNRGEIGDSHLFPIGSRVQ